MNKFLPLVLLCYLCSATLIIIDASEANGTVLHRNRRYLAFMNTTRFFMKVNFKVNSVPWNQLFAQAVGFRMNWDDPPDSYRYPRIYRRDVYDHVETLLDRNGLVGFHCVRRAICEIQMIQNPNIYHKLLKMLFRKISSTTERWHNSSPEECYTSLSSCPLSLLAVSPYTDIS
ncbi:uncharacterized protein LOC113506567 [Trichoplusia ni]|uniref:Uncharacterized protein LOC113503297 n=1 Tax=Trichoplusia ni TaxID=7111 RepID=A0A7E5WKT8_TRINI|nr:uncharacterized protein LOC113503297 [Trichoplusia ni]XP_026740981.1 uncharacterized protein LOC113503320 [Trichoplusia ni]XP_026745208.1 uncharacterized protein LOC113506567 [Trichoplusia ni]